MLLLLAAALTVPLLRAADVSIVMSPTTCDVTMKLTIDGAAEIDHRVDSTLIDLIEVTGAQTVGDMRTVGVTRSLTLRPTQASYQIHYVAMLPEARKFRCPLWLPVVPTDGQSRAVALHVEIPRGASPSDSMPMLVWKERLGEATLGHLPSFVHVPFTPQGVSTGWGISRTMDAITISLVVGASAIWLWWRKGRR
jgi:hypothetical protein